jgi:hypothetical protein
MSNWRTKSEPAKQHQDKDDDQQKADPAIDTMAKAISWTTAKPAESTQQKNDENDQKNGTYRHRKLLLGTGSAMTTYVLN